jgi:hypothetical protein
MKASILISRPDGKSQSFTGTIIKESSTHYLVVHDKNDSSNIGEWFPKNSKFSSCIKLQD